LQVGPAAEQLATFPKIRRHVLDTFDATAGVAVQLDAVVSVDTSVAHLAAACGVPTLMLLTRDPAERWGWVGERTPWYQSMCLLRQRAAGDWRDVIARAAQRIGDSNLPPRLGAAIAMYAERT